VNTHTVQQDTTIINHIDTTKIEMHKDSINHSTIVDNTIIEESIIEQIVETKPDSTIIQTKREIKRTIKNDIITEDTTQVQSSINVNTHIYKDSTNINIVNSHNIENNLKKNGLQQVLIPVVLILTLIIILLLILQKWF
jgi:hypothetical protein